MIRIPLLNGANNTHQKFSVRLGDNLLDFRVNFISYLKNPAWELCVYRDGAPLILGAKLEPGAEVSRGYRAGIGRLFFVGKEVTLDNLGVENQLVWTQV